MEAEPRVSQITDVPIVNSVDSDVYLKEFLPEYFNTDIQLDLGEINRSNDVEHKNGIPSSVSDLNNLTRQAIAEANQGNMNRLMEVMSTVQHTIERDLTSRGLSREDAADILQEVYISVVTKIQQFHSVTNHDYVSFRGWARTIARNRSIDEARTHKRRSNIAAFGSDTLDAVDISYDETNIHKLINPDQSEEAISQALATAPLSKTQRNVLILRYWHDLSYREIAQYLNIPEGTVKSSMNRAVEKMRDTIVFEKLER